MTGVNFRNISFITSLWNENYYERLTETVDEKYKEKIMKAYMRI